MYRLGIAILGSQPVNHGSDRGQWEGEIDFPAPTGSLHFYFAPDSTNYVTDLNG